MTSPAPPNTNADLLAEHADVLRDAIAAADPATLLLVLVQLSGERAWLDRARPYIAGPMNYQETMPDEMREAIRAELFDTLLDYARHSRPWPPIPSGVLLSDMLGTAAGGAVGEDYAAMMREDLDPAHHAPRELAHRDARRSVPSDFSAIIIGAGMSGLGAAIYLQEAGIPFVILEKGSAVGGTWHQNAYPGCGVDTPNHFYSYSFEPNYDWSHFYAKRDELWRYFETIADRHSLRPHIRLSTEVVSAAWDEAAARWTVVSRGSDGVSRTDTARIVISAVGILSRPKWPEIEGLECFVGAKLHSGAWDSAFDWRGKRVALIGTGASGHQMGPTLAPDVAKLSIFQRSPHWVVPNPNYFLEVTPGKQWALEHIPFYARWYRFQLFWAFADGLHEALKVDPIWSDPARSINRINDRHRQFMERFIKAELGENSPLLAKVLPSYPPYGKRILIDNRWYGMLKRPNVELITDQIRRIVPEGIETDDGVIHPVDAILCATGFQASKMLAPMQVTGRRGVELHQLWKHDDATAYQGTMVPDFPNFFLLLGPNTALAHGGNAIFIVECQMRLIMNALNALLEEGHRSIEVRRSAHDAYVAEVDRLHRGMVWSHPGVKSWYRNPAGRVFAVLPFRLVDFWKMTSALDRDALAFGD